MDEYYDDFFTYILDDDLEGLLGNIDHADGALRDFIFADALKMDSVRIVDYLYLSDPNIIIDDNAIIENIATGKYDVANWYLYNAGFMISFDDLRYHFINAFIDFIRRREENAELHSDGFLINIYDPSDPILEHLEDAPEMEGVTRIAIFMELNDMGSSLLAASNESIKSPYSQPIDLILNKWLQNFKVGG